MKKKILILSTALCIGYNVNAQVGIGNASPDPTSILDLTNSTNSGLLLPSVSTTTAMSASEKMMYYFNNNIYFKTSLGYNALSPWKFKFNGGISNDMFYNLGGNIGIGSNDITVSPLSPLHIETNNPVSLTNNGSFLIGTSLGTSLAFNSTEIQTKSGVSSAPLQINEDGGDVTLGSTATSVNIEITGNVEIVGTVKQKHAPSNDYYDLLPAGSIIMFYSSDIPEGWALCNGDTKSRSSGVGTIITPNLLNRFIRSQANTGETNGSDNLTLTTANIPAHTHGFYANTSSSGNHSHTHNGYRKVTGGVSGGDHVKSKEQVSADGASYGGNAAGSHIHSVSGTTDSGNVYGNSFNNMPAYYSLVYIMKL